MPCTANAKTFAKENIADEPTTTADVGSAGSDSGGPGSEGSGSGGSGSGGKKAKTTTTELTTTTATKPRTTTGTPVDGEYSAFSACSNSSDDGVQLRDCALLCIYI